MLFSPVGRITGYTVSDEHPTGCLRRSLARAARYRPALLCVRVCVCVCVCVCVGTAESARAEVATDSRERGGECEYSVRFSAGWGEDTATVCEK